MKKLCLIFVLVVGVLFGGAAIAEGVLVDNAYILADTMYYAGSVDGETVGVYQMNPNGTNSRKIADGDYILMSVSNGNLLLKDWEKEEIIILDGNGAERYRKEAYTIDAITANGWFYLGAFAVADDGSREKTFVETEGDEMWMITPAAVDENNYYYLDRRAYAEMMIEYVSCDELHRVSLADGTVRKISAPGTSLIGCDGESVYYTRQSFMYYNDGAQDAIQAQVDQGLFKAKADGTGEVRLADAGEITEDEYIHYALLDGGVLYGMKWNFAAEEVEYTLIRTSVNGESYPELRIDEDVLHGIWKGKVVASKCVFYDDGDAYGQADQLVALDIDSQVSTLLNPDGEYRLYYSEVDPCVGISGDSAYFTAYDVETYATGLYAAKLDGSGVMLLAKGISR